MFFSLLISIGFNPNLLAKLKYSEATQTRNGSQKDNNKPNQINPNRLASMVAQIKEFFPQLTDSVVKDLLSANDYDPEKVVDLISMGEIPNLFS